MYGKTGIHMILKGSVLAQFKPYLITDSKDFGSQDDSKDFGSQQFESTVNSNTKPKKVKENVQHLVFD